MFHLERNRGRDGFWSEERRSSSNRTSHGGDSSRKNDSSSTNDLRQSNRAWGHGIANGHPDRLRTPNWLREWNRRRSHPSWREDGGAILGDILPAQEHGCYENERESEEQTPANADHGDHLKRVSAQRVWETKHILIGVLETGGDRCHNQAVDIPDLGRIAAFPLTLLLPAPKMAHRTSGPGVAGNVSKT